MKWVVKIANNYFYRALNLLGVTRLYNKKVIKNTSKPADNRDEGNTKST